MPNICNYSMKVNGKEENVKKFYEWLSANYQYSNKDDIHCYHTVNEEKVPCEHHIGYRVFSAYTWEDFNITPFPIEGDCAWSVYSCMFNDGLGTYMGDNDKDDTERYAISILDASRKLELAIEIFSTEPGMGFSEHYYMENGDLILEDTVDLRSYYLPEIDKNSDEFDANIYEKLNLSEKEKEYIDYLIAEGDTYAELSDNYNIETCDWYWEYLQ